MSILGVRVSSQEIRYAILEKSDEHIVFTNKDTENRLKYPASCTDISEKLLWAKNEIDRILRQNNSIEKIIIKMNEYSGTENGSKRETTYIDAILLLCAAEHNLPVERKLYSQIGASSSRAKELAEQRIGRTEKYWNITIADAILVAYWEMRK